MNRSHLQNKKLHAMFSDFARGFCFEGERLTAAEWKIILCSYFNSALAEADGLEVRNIPLPESTSKMDVSRMDNMIEYCHFIGAMIGVNFTD